MSYESDYLPGVFFIQAEGVEVEYLTVPEWDGIWKQKLPLEEGDLFLRSAINWVGEDVLWAWIVTSDWDKVELLFKRWWAEREERLAEEEAEEEARRKAESVDEIDIESLPDIAPPVEEPVSG